jgi:hypothetical protein
MKQAEVSDYTININKESQINIWTNKWVLEWCKKYHPEAFEEANKFIMDYLKDNDEINKE